MSGGRAWAGAQPLGPADGPRHALALSDRLLEAGLWPAGAPLRYATDELTLAYDPELGEWRRDWTWEEP